MVHLLYVEGREALRDCTYLFEQYMEPLLAILQDATDRGILPVNLAEIRQGLQVCRWPFRRLEYSFVLDILLASLKRGDKYLDAGCGVTPLAHILAGKGICAHACDANRRLIDALLALRTETVYGTSVTYSTEDLTALSYPDGTFDAISCVSVLEHIAAPPDQMAVRELLRILKPDGVLVLTVDFAPSSSALLDSGLAYLVRRSAQLARAGNFREVLRGIARKVRARMAVRNHRALNPRSANQSFSIAHLEQDIMPLLREHVPIESDLPFPTDLRAANPTRARSFWNLQHGLYEDQGRRDVLPVGCIIRKYARSDRGSRLSPHP